MLNNFILVGHVETINTTTKTLTLKTQTPYKNDLGEYEDNYFDINFSNPSSIFENIQDYLSVGDLVGVKGHLSSPGNDLAYIPIKLICDKLTCISSHHPNAQTQDTMNEGEI